MSSRNECGYMEAKKRVKLGKQKSKERVFIAAPSRRGPGRSMRCKGVYFDSYVGDDLYGFTRSSGLAVTHGRLKRVPMLARVLGSDWKMRPSTDRSAVDTRGGYLGRNERELFVHLGDLGFALMMHALIIPASEPSKGKPPVAMAYSSTSGRHTGLTIQTNVILRAPKRPPCSHGNVWRA